MNINFIYHLKVTKNNFYAGGEQAFDLIQGLEVVIPMSIDIDYFSKIPSDSSVQVQTPTNLFNLSQIDQIPNILTITITYRHWKFCPVPPFLMSTLFDSNKNHNGSARNNLVNCIKAIKDFDATYANED